MSEPKDATSFFRKVAKFVANPSTEWAEIGMPSTDTGESELAKGELKAMIERKRRNDFVRKREFDMLRKVRREGLTSEQLAALGGSSRLDDSEARIGYSGAKPDSGVKAKIDEIEQQMVGDGTYAAHSKPKRTAEFYNAPTEPAPMEMTAPRRTTSNATLETRLANIPLATPAVVMGAGVSPLSSVSSGVAEPGLAQPFAQELTEVAHDPELD